MLTVNGVPDELETTYGRFKDLSKEIFSHVQDLAEPTRVSPDTCLLEGDARDAVFYIQEGYFKLNFGPKNIRLYSDPDFFDPALNFAGFSLSSEFASFVVFFERDRLFHRIFEDPELTEKWLRLGRMENEINLSLCAYFLADEVHPNFEMRQIQEGETILKEGAEPTEILEMIEGDGDVIHTGRVIGHITPGEIFGEIGFLTGTKRSATVVATSRCILRIVGKEDFLALVKTNPDLGIAISKTLAKRIIELNNRLKGFEL